MYRRMLAAVILPLLFAVFATGPADAAWGWVELSKAGTTGFNEYQAKGPKRNEVWAEKVEYTCPGHVSSVKLEGWHIVVVSYETGKLDPKTGKLEIKEYKKEIEFRGGNALDFAQPPATPITKVGVSIDEDEIC